MNNQFYESLKNNLLLKNTDITSLNLDEVKGSLIRVGEGEIVYREGVPSDFIYLVVSGQINIIKRKLLGKAKSYVYGANEFFGNDEYFEETSRTTTAVALQDSYLIVLSREEIENLVLQDSEIFLALRESLSDLFDNSTEINITENELPNEAPVSEIEKIITGAEIQEGFEDSPPSELVYENIEETSADEIIPEESIPGIQHLNENIDIQEVPVEIATEEPVHLEDFIIEEPLQSEEKYFILSGPPEKSENELEDPANSVGEEPAPIEGDDSFIASAINAYDEPLPSITGQTIDETDILESLANEEPPAGELPADTPITEIGETEAVNSESFLSNTEPDIIPDQQEIEDILIINELEEEINSSIRAEDVLEETNTYALSDDEAGGEMNTEEVNKLIRAMELVNSTITIDELLTSIVNVACDLTSADRGTLYLVDKEKGELWSKIALGTEPKEIRLKIGEGIAGNVARTKIIENIKDVTQHPMFKKDVDKSSGYVTKNMLCFPLKNKDEEVIGVLQLLNSKMENSHSMMKNY